MYKGDMDKETIFVEILGKSPIVRVLDFLITYQSFDYSLTEIAEKAGVGYSTLQTFWNKLVQNKIVLKTRRLGKSDLYKLNTKNPAVQQLIKLDWNFIHGAENEPDTAHLLSPSQQGDRILATS